MAIQAQMYPDNLGLPLGGSQDWLMMDNNHNNINNSSSNNNNNMFLFNGGCGLNELSYNVQQKLQQQQQFQYQQQQQYLAQLQNLQQQQQQQQRNQPQNQSLSSDNAFVFLPTSRAFNNTTTTTASTTTTATTTTTTSTDQIPLNFSQGLVAQLEKQSHDIDRYISLQNEWLKLALQEQRRQQLAIIIKKVEAKAMMLLNQKDEEIAKATNRRMELEEFVRKMEMENQTWQRVAAEKEAMVVSLNNTLEQLKEQACCSLTCVDDAESCCDDNDYPCNNRVNEEEEATGTGTGTGFLATGEEQRTMMDCRVCKYRNASVLLLPCRHLCCCKTCEACLDVCPLCKSLKKASIEALLS